MTNLNRQVDEYCRAVSAADGEAIKAVLRKVPNARVHEFGEMVRRRGSDIPELPGTEALEAAFMAQGMGQSPASRLAALSVGDTAGFFAACMEDRDVSPASVVTAAIGLGMETEFESATLVFLQRALEGEAPSISELPEEAREHVGRALGADPEAFASLE